MDFGKPAIQLIADFSFDDFLRRENDALSLGPHRWFHRPGLVRCGYLGLVHRISGRSGYDGGDDWIVANSRWVAGVLQSRLGLVSNRVIYPPVVADGPDVPWEGRATGFTILGRVSFEKRIERVIDILGRVRAAGHAIHLHVVGGIGDDGYGRLIRDRIAANAGWCFADGPKMGEEKVTLLAQHRFAIHGRRGEAFGIAVAEQVKAGCIPFVPSEGGPAEIVGTDQLTYRDEDEAVAKIVALLEDPGRQTHLREHLAHRAGMFSAERFMSEVRSLVDDWLARGT